MERPLEELGGALEKGLERYASAWRLFYVERSEGWFELERKRLFRANVKCRVRLVSVGQGRTRIEVEASSPAQAEWVASEVADLVDDMLQEAD